MVKSEIGDSNTFLESLRTGTSKNDNDNSFWSKFNDYINSYITFILDFKTYKISATIISLIIFQALIHLGVNIRLFPTTGMTLPFLSYGGSSIIGASILSGIILNLTKRKVN